jgi:hypothetical protein
MVGDAQVPLLRIVPVEGRDGEMITRVLRVLQRYCQVHVLFDIVFPQIPDILFLLGVCNNRGKLSYRNEELGDVVQGINIKQAANHD